MPLKQLRRQAILPSVAIAYLIVAGTLMATGPQQSIEWMIYDNALTWQQPPASSKLLFATIAASRTEEVARQAAALAEAVRQLHKARAVVLDVHGKGLAADASALRQLVVAVRQAGNVYLPRRQDGAWPAPLVQAAAGIGHVQASPDADGMVRSLPAFVATQGRLYPALALLVASRLGDTAMPNTPRLRPILATARQQRIALRDLLAVTSKAAGRIVIVEADSEHDRIDTPWGSMSQAEFTARAAAAIAAGRLISRPGWASATEVLLLVGLCLLLLAWRFLPTPRLPWVVAICVLLIAAALMALLVFGIWLQWTTLVLMFAAAATLRTVLAPGSPPPFPQQDAAKMQALSYHSQGMLDMAFARYRHCTVDEEIAEGLYNLALAYERQRHFAKAAEVYNHIRARRADYRDVSARLSRCQQAENSLTLRGNRPFDTLLITGGSRPILGRYEIIRELGKGAMGKVYLGVDLTIRRQVAIKTLALAQEFDADELDEVKARFFREAETAGRLNHPNIVTIYAAGEDRDLAFIAMELLRGTDLTPFTKRERLLKPAAALKIAGKIAAALHYAHSHGVVHRDIKPANIMLQHNKTVKVMDFGIARITASTRTKTGIVLGTPSYMSPEQLSGRHVDGRSDLFSLGVMLYELLCGVRPFRGSSMASLMYRITNDDPEDVRQHRPDLPTSVARLLERALAKNADDRFANGREMAAAIIACLHELNPKAAA